VTTNKHITVTAWSESQRPIFPGNRTHRRFLPSAVTGLVGTLLLHTFALQTVFLGTRAHKIRPPELQESGSPTKSEGKPAESLVFIDLPKATSTDNGIVEALASIRAAIKETPLTSPPDPSPPLELEILSLSEDKPSDSSVESGDGVERARLIGIYTGQIQARVQRIWRRPRSPVTENTGTAMATHADESFQCQVQVVQDKIGNVQEVLLPRCNGTEAWQRSLVIAIQQASPLPAPPSASVFSNSITLNFLGLSYVAGSPEDEYEIVPMNTLQALLNPPATRPSQLDPRFVPGPPLSPSPASAPELEQTTN
jgi:TonB C terminal